MRGVRAVHFTDTYLPRRDGVITSIRTLAAALADAGHPGLLVVPRHPDQPREPNLLRLRAIPCGVADLVVQTYHTDLHAYADAYRVPAPALRAGVRLYARRLGVPRPPTLPAPTSGGNRAVVRRGEALDATNVLLLSGAHAVVVPTPAVLDRMQLPVPAERVFLVPTGVAPRRTSPPAVADFRHRYGLAPDDRVVLFVGRVNREKGVDLLISAFARVLAGCPRARLVLVGALYEPRWLAALLREAGPRVAARVTLTGQQPPDVVAAAYATAEVFTFPSRTDTQALVL